MKNSYVSKKLRVGLRKVLKEKQMYKTGASSWFNLNVAAAQEITELVSMATLGSEIGTRAVSSTYSYPIAPTTLRVTGVRIGSTLGGTPILSFLKNPLSTQFVSTLDTPNCIEIDFNLPPDAPSVTPASVSVVGAGGGVLGGGIIAFLSPVSVRLSFAAAFPAGDYLIRINGTTLPIVTLGGLALDGESLGLPSGTARLGGDFVIPFIVTTAVVPAATPTAPLKAASLWGPSFAYVMSSPICRALRSDDQLAIAKAEQWNFAHQTLNGSAELPPPLNSWIYLRVGEQWKMEILMNFGSEEFSDIQLSFLHNAATHGLFRNRVPVISFSQSYTQVNILSLTLVRPGLFSIGIRMIDTGGIYSMFELKCIVVP